MFWGVTEYDDDEEMYVSYMITCETTHMEMESNVFFVFVFAKGKTCFFVECYLQIYFFNSLYS